MVEYDVNGGFSIDTIARRLERTGSNVTNYGKHHQINIYTIDFYMVGAQGDELFPSSAEISGSGELEMAQLRLPTFTAEPDEGGLDFEQYEAMKKSAVIDVWEDIREAVGEIIADEVGAEYSYGVLQNEGMTMRAQHGNEMRNVTPHIEFLRTMDGEAPVNLDELIAIVSRINDVWEKKFFYVETVSRTDL